MGEVRVGWGEMVGQLEQQESTITARPTTERICPGNVRIPEEVQKGCFKKFATEGRMSDRKLALGCEAARVREGEKSILWAAGLD
jgi:hypothetical protein